jgi:hypothetical protein
MSKWSILRRPTRVSDLSFDDLYEEISSNWHLRAEELQDRRWRKLLRDQD